jgi:hypothetical protein
MHEDRDDQTRLRKHEQQNQGPSEITLKAKIVDEIGACAQHEQPTPHDQKELYWRLMRFGVRRFLRHDFLLTKDRKAQI